jgi:hypothetical protein
MHPICLYESHTRQSHTPPSSSRQIPQANHTIKRMQQHPKKPHDLISANRLQFPIKIICINRQNQPMQLKKQSHQKHPHQHVNNNIHSSTKAHTPLLPTTKTRNHLKLIKLT